MYSVGLLLRPSNDDQVFEEVEDAEVAAIQSSIDDDVWAVRDDNDSEIQSVVYQRQVFSA